MEKLVHFLKLFFIFRGKALRKIFPDFTYFSVRRPVCFRLRHNVLKGIDFIYPAPFQKRAQKNATGFCTYGVSVEQQKRDTIDENGIPAL